MRRLLFVHNKLTTFARFDLESFGDSFEVTELPLLSRWVNPFAVWRQVSSYDCVYCQLYHLARDFSTGYAARMQDKPSILVIGGYDLAKIPESEGQPAKRGNTKTR